MFHLGLEVLRRVLRGEGTVREAEVVAEHVVSCDPCRALAGTLIDELRAELRRRAQDYRDDPENVVTWEELEIWMLAGGLNRLAEFVAS